MFFNNEIKTASAFNPALKYVESIASLLDILDGSLLRCDYLKSHRILMRIYGRVEHKLSEQESGEIQKLFDDSLKELKNNKVSRLKREDGFHTKLIVIEKKLKRYMDNYGLMMPSKEDPRFAVLKR